ncbi:MAG TPA: hypothetical protein VMH20_18240 [Verrucomicrobiae bacterium]|nr:hypothetical protein [Verrucomicrobiae bacterium]
MKARTITQILALSALLLPCLASPVNSHALVPSASRTVMDGVPLPPPVPNPPKTVTDGVPLPPPVPNPPKGVTGSVTDGVPLPPPVRG